MDLSTALRDFLVSRRARLRPDDVGLPVHGTRRVAGLRREEIAALAAMSVEHYTRLERGKASRVSDAVLTAVADALRLSPGERRYLHSLARPATADDGAGPSGVRPSVRSVLDSMLLAPAYLVGRGGTVLAWNRLATAVFVDFAQIHPEGRTIGRLVFTDPRTRLLYLDWERKARETVAYLRTEVGRRPHDPVLAEEISQLCSRSQDFRRLWRQQVVLETTHSTFLIAHPPSEALELSCEALQLAGDPDELIVAYTAAPGSASEAALHRLALGPGITPAAPGR
ncbi:helix-turn-helix transcriptional regulator [Kitasatospora nipponensis]|uniref:Helix-turn-helix transcriptional regulator n=1 Tax=Kitasatospora nipponensis TaxID=258049 RepID=A0ABN1WRM9_9ACTN